MSSRRSNSFSVCSPLFGHYTTIFEGINKLISYVAPPVTAVAAFSNPWVWAGAGLQLLLQLAITYWAPLNAAFATAPIDGLLHPKNILDTLGADAPEKLCKSRS